MESLAEWSNTQTLWCCWPFTLVTVVWPWCDPPPWWGSAGGAGHWSHTPNPRLISVSEQRSERAPADAGSSWVLFTCGCQHPFCNLSLTDNFDDDLAVEMCSRMSASRWRDSLSERLVNKWLRLFDFSYLESTGLVMITIIPNPFSRGHIIYILDRKWMNLL